MPGPSLEASADTSASAPSEASQARSDRGQRVSEHRIATAMVAGLVVAFAIAWGISSALAQTLYRPTFVTGWILFALVGAVALSWWRPVRELEELATRARRQGLLQLFTLTAFLVHVDLRWPTGAIEAALSLLFVASTLSWSFGLALATTRDTARTSDASDSTYVRLRRLARESRCARWLRLHAALLGALVALGLFHGAFVHLHGLLAHLLFGEGGAS